MRMSKLLIIFGAILILVGLLYPYLSRIGLGRLPGDLQFKMGDIEDSLQTLDEVLSLEPKHKYALEFQNSVRAVSIE